MATIKTPAGIRDTRITLAKTVVGTTKTQWQLTPPDGNLFTIQTTAAGTDTENVSSSDLRTLNIWLPPSHAYSLRTRHFINGSWASWSSSSTFTSRSPLNSYEKYLALSGLGGVDNISV